MRSPTPKYVVDADDPRAPPQDVWDQLDDRGRAAIVASLPCEFPLDEASPPEGDPHFLAKARTRDLLDSFYGRIRRGAYIGAELPVYYPGERMFAPDVMVVLDVSPHSRDRWVVSAEGKGLDVAMEIHYSGRRLKDLQRNVERYARLGIPESFVYEIPKSRLRGFRLFDDRAAYEPIVPQGGRFTSHTMGLDLGIEGGRLRFYYGAAALPEDKEMVARLEAALDEVTVGKEEAERRAEEETRRADEIQRRAEEEARRAEEEARRADEIQRRLDEALAELERLKRR